MKLIRELMTKRIL